MQPLSRDNRHPPKQDLRPFWDRVDRALLGLGPEIRAEHFHSQHIRQVAPVVLGEPVWELVKNEVFTSWGDLRVVVDRRFGLSSRQVLNAFYGMRPSAGETEARFIERVEDRRL